MIRQHNPIYKPTLLCLPALLALCFSPAFAQSTSTDEKAETKLPEIKVLGSGEQKYLSKLSSTATKTETLLLDTPQAISVVTKDLIRDQSLRSMADVIRYVPGIVTAQGEGNRDTAVFRGNSSTGDFFVDGIRDDVQYFRDFYNIESVEALKGSNAMIFGRGGSGGVINRVSKQAQWTPLQEASFTFGSWKNRRASVDLGTPINANLALRVNGMVENGDSFRDGFHAKRKGVTPTLALRIGADTLLNLSYEHFRDDRTADRGIPSYLGKPLDVAASRFIGNAELSNTWSQVDAFSALLEHDFGAGINLRNRTRIANYDKFYQNVFSGAVSADGKNVSLNGYNNATQRKNLFNQTDLSFESQLAGLKHRYLLGLELGQQNTDNFRNTAYFPSAGNATSIVVPLTQATTNNVVFKQSASDANNHGVATVAAIYAQDQIEISPQWQAILGLRRDQFKVDFTNNRNASKIEHTDTPISPRVGLVFKPEKALSLYASYSLAFAPRAGDQLSSLTPSNQAFEPEKYTNLEIGTKWDVRPDLNFSAALYHLDRKNMVITDPSDPTKSILIDGQRSQGLELAVNGRITPEWSVVGGYAYQDAKLSKTQSASLKAGATLAQVPTHSASLWNRYDFNRAWGMGLGIVYRGQIYPSTDNTVTIPGFTRIDAAAYYAWDQHLQFQLNIENLNDTRYYASANSNNNISPGSPRAIRLGINLKF